MPPAKPAPPASSLDPIDLAVGDKPGSDAPARQGQTIGADRYTMTEAAKLKGVSYHTVSRAVRKGRLPVARLGRMALIAADDLRAWRPMLERAPRRYRKQQVAQQASPIFLDDALGERLELAREMSNLYEIIHGASAEMPLARFAATLCEQMGQVFRLSRLSLWVVNEDRTRAIRLAAIGTRMSSMADDVAVEEFPAFKQFLEHTPVRVSVDPRTEAPVSFDPVPRPRPGPILSIPLRVGTRPIGALFGDRDGSPVELSPDQMALAAVLANQAALALDNAVLRDREQHRIEHLSWILEQTPDAIRACDADGRLTLINATDRRVTGLTDMRAHTVGMDARLNPGVVARHELDGTPIPEDQHPLNRALQGERVEGWEYIATLSSGNRINVLVNAKPIEINGEVTGAVYAARNVTDARTAQARDAARIAETERATSHANALTTLLREMHATDTTDDVIAVASRRMRIELAGDHVLVLMRDDSGTPGTLTLREPEGSCRADRLPRQYDPFALPHVLGTVTQHQPVLLARDDASAQEAELMAACDAAAFLVIPLLADGEVIGAAMVSYLIVPDDGALDLVFAATLGQQTAQTFTQVDAVRRWAASYRQLLTVIDQMPQGVLIVDAPDGMVSVANRAAFELFGERIEPATMRADELRMVDGDGRPYDRETHPLIQPLRSGESFLGQPLTVLRGDGSLMDVLGSHSPIRNDAGAITGVVSVLQDRRQFTSLDRTKDEFLSVVAHELRNPLTSLRGNLQLIQRRIRKRGAELDEQDAFGRITLVIEQVDRIAELVSRMLDISRVDLGRLDLAIAETDASAVTQAVVSSIAGIAAEREIRVTAPERLPVRWDEVRVEQILMNLLTNAVRYAPDGPIDVHVHRQGDDRVCITVRDFGPGVPSRIRKRLFKQYYRFDDGQEDRERALDGSQGLGIGLYISARLARAHGGTLDVDNPDDGGSRFRLTLPAAVEDRDDHGFSPS